MGKPLALRQDNAEMQWDKMGAPAAVDIRGEGGRVTAPALLSSLTADSFSSAGAIPRSLFLHCFKQYRGLRAGHAEGPAIFFPAWDNNA
jgi:hypothetical protein